MKRHQKNIFNRALHHLKSTQIDEKLKILNEMPTNNTASIYIIEPEYTVQDPDVEGLPRTVDFTQDALANGKDTTGLFLEDGTILTIEPPGDTSYILGPMASMWYAWGNFTTFGYIRQSDRRMVDLGRITGQLGSWNGTSNFTSYGQLTLEQAVWFRDTPKLNGADNNTPNYRAFYPGPPSNVPDQYGRYLCVITGTPKSTSATPPPRRVPPTRGGFDPNLPPGSAKPKKKGEEEISQLLPIPPGPSGYKKPGTYDPEKFYKLAPGSLPSPNIPQTGPGLSQANQDTQIANAQLDPQERKELKMLLKFYKGGGGGSGSDIDKQIRNLEIKLYGIPISASYEPQGKLISESRQRIIRNIKKPLVFPEVKIEKIKHRPKVIGALPKTINSDLMKKAEVPTSFTSMEDKMWRKMDKKKNSILSQERKNQVLDHLGGSNHVWEYMTETGRIRNENVIHTHFGNNKEKLKVIRKEEIKGDALVLLVDDKNNEEILLQSELSIRLADKFNKELFEKYFDEQQTMQYDNDPLFKKVSKRLKTVIDYPDKPAKAGYPDEPPPEMINGWHPEYGQDKGYYNKLDPQSAKAMPFTGNLRIDTKISRARKQAK